MTDEKRPPATSIHEAMSRVMAEVGYVQKRGQMQGAARYSYAKEADFIAAIRPAMVQEGVFIVPHKVETLTTEVVHTAKGTPMNRVVIRVAFLFCHSSGGTIEVTTLGEGMDSGDKACNKALTGAMKYAMRQAFCIETGDDPDDTPSEHQERADLTRLYADAERIVAKCGIDLDKFLGWADPDASTIREIRPGNLPRVMDELYRRERQHDAKK